MLKTKTFSISVFFMAVLVNVKPGLKPQHLHKATQI